MGVVLSKRNASGNGGHREASVAEKSSCGLSEYWTGKERDFRRSYFDDADRDGGGGQRSAARASDFRITTLLDEGAFGSVALTTHNRTGVVYATKVIAKKKISKRDHLVSVYTPALYLLYASV